MADLIIIGAGPGGMDTAIEAARQNKRVVLIEKDKVGGTCLNRGCIPTKALLHTSQQILEAENLKLTGIFAGTDFGTTDYANIIERKDTVVDELREGATQSLRGVELVRGEATLVDANTVEVNGDRYSAEKIIIATGSAPNRLDIPGKEYALTSDELLTRSDFWVSGFTSVAIIGGGVIGIEIASILLGLYPEVQITVVEYCKEILPGFDKDIAKRLRMSLTKRGIKFVTAASVTEIGDGYTLTYTKNGTPSEIKADKIIMATGRKPVFPKGLEQIGVEYSNKGIKVDSRFMTNIESVYAIGDVNGICMLAHVATAQGKKVLGMDIDLDVVPSAVFSTPECAMVGLTEEACVEKGIPYEVRKAFFRANGKAVTMDQTEGLVKILVGKDTNKILGVHICGPHASDLIAEPALGIVNKLGVEDFLRTIHAHPTLNEIIISALNE